ncbi:MAG: hypothetical protein B7733_14095 [Myxococcales bacterium FL481]|nr:MAG: hypothetical protein B7733_14095 [Myxococcales bacterium FL481]
MDFSQAERRVFDAVWDLVARRTYDRAAASTDLLHQLLHAQGAVSRRGDHLCVGDLVLNRDRSPLAAVAEATGLGLTVYLGSHRVASATVSGAGTAPDLDAPAPAPLVDAALRRREAYKGRVDYGQRTYIVAGRPLFGSNTEPDAPPLGMLEAFQDEHIFLDLLAATARAGLQDQTSDLVARADAMESILRFVDDIARRLQLLALNGNIIAAQAPEHGRAFRVVCRELGALAGQAKNTGNDVRQLAVAMGFEGFGEDSVEPSGPADALSDSGLQLEAAADPVSMADLAAAANDTLSSRG